MKTIMRQSWMVGTPSRFGIGIRSAQRAGAGKVGRVPNYRDPPHDRGASLPPSPVPDGGQGTSLPAILLSGGAFIRIGLLAVLAMLAAPLPAALAQTDGSALTNRPEGKTNAPPTDSPSPARQARAYEQATEKIRAECVQGRRTVCGKILKILPDGLVVESGYTNLMRAPLSRSWLAPGTVQATREVNLVEGSEPGCVCTGLVFLTALPKSRAAAKPKPYDYVVIQAYPAGQYTYTSVGTLQRTVRRFAAALPTAIRLNRDAAGIKPPIIMSEAGREK